MTWSVVYESSSGRQVSSGTVVASPLPQGLSAVALSDADAAMLLEGRGRWDEATRCVVANPPSIPESVTARQIRLWLVTHGVSLAQVDAAISAIPSAAQREAVRVEWEYAPYVERSHPMLIPLASALGMTEAEVDAAFGEAAGL